MIIKCVKTKMKQTIFKNDSNESHHAKTHIVAFYLAKNFVKLKRNLRFPVLSTNQVLYNSPILKRDIQRLSYPH